jgi:WD40 repeat protein
MIGCEKRQDSDKEAIQLDRPEGQYVGYNSAQDFSYTPAPTVVPFVPSDLNQYILGNWRIDDHYNESRNKNGVMHKTTDTRGYVFFGENGLLSQERMPWGTIYDGNWSINSRESWVGMDFGDSETEAWWARIIDQNHIEVVFSRNKEEQITRYTREDREITKIIDNDNIEELRQYLGNGGNIEERLLFSLTPLMYAIYNGKPDTALFLIEQGADLSAKNITDYTALHYAVLYSNIEDNILLRILGKGVDVNMRDIRNEFSYQRDYNQTVLDLTITDVRDENKRKIALLLSEYGAVCSNNELQEIVNNTMSRVMTFEHSAMIRYYEDVFVAFSPNGSQIVSGGEDKRIQLWDVATGLLIRAFTDESEFYAHSSAVTSLAFSPDGSKIISGSYDNTIKLWDTATGSLIRTFTGHSGGFSSGVLSVAFSPDGSQIVSGAYDKTIKLWDVATGQEIKTFTGHRNMVTVVAFSPDGTQIVSGSDEARILLWDISSGLAIRTFYHIGGVLSVAISPDGTKIVASSIGVDIRLYDTATSEQIWEAWEISDPVFSMAFSPNGTQILSGSMNGRVLLRDTATAKINAAFEADYIVRSVAFSPDGRYIAAASREKKITIWDTTIVRH